MTRYKLFTLENGCEIAIVVSNIESLNLSDDKKKLNIQMRSGKNYVVPNKNNSALGEWCYYSKIFD